MAKVKEYFRQDVFCGWTVLCPACLRLHIFQANFPGSLDGWYFNGDINKPTFRPALLAEWLENGEMRRCRCEVTDGQIRFLSDCLHHLKNRTVDLPDWDDPMVMEGIPEP